MLNPDQQVLLTEALRPPVGYSIDHAITTTYTLGLHATLLAPMAFAAAATDSVRQDLTSDSIGMLDAVQRYIGHTTVFVQAGGIHVPATHSKLLAFLEGSIYEVEPPAAQWRFHPKIWAIRYVNEHSAYHHRLIVSSRNLTLDNSWDTILVLEEDPAGTIEASPAAAFIAELPSLTLRTISPGRHRNLTDLAASFASVKLAPPEGYTHGQILPMGFQTPQWRFPTNAKRTLVISPFLSTNQLQVARSTAEEAVLISRAESMDALGVRQLQGWQTRVLHTAAEDWADEIPEDRSEVGLHAKTAVIDIADESLTITGSANFTKAAWHGNIEFNVVLSGPTETTGVEAILGDAEQISLSSVTEAYRPSQDEPVTDRQLELQYQIEDFHRQLARTQPVLNLFHNQDQTVRARLHLDLPDHELADTTRVWLYTVSHDQRRLSEDIAWTVAPINATSFLAVETTGTVDGTTVRRRRIITCRLTGDFVDRRQAVLADILSNPASVLSYLALILGLDPLNVPDVQGEVTTAHMPTGPLESERSTAMNPQIVLFEPLMYAMRNPAQLDTIGRQIEELRALPHADAAMPADFLAMWDVVQEVIRRGASDEPTT